MAEVSSKYHDAVVWKIRQAVDKELSGRADDGLAPLTGEALADLQTRTRARIEGGDLAAVQKEYDAHLARVERYQREHPSQRSR